MPISYFTCPYGGKAIFDYLIYLVSLSWYGAWTLVITWCSPFPLLTVNLSTKAIVDMKRFSKSHKLLLTYATPNMHVLCNMHGFRSFSFMCYACYLKFKKHISYVNFIAHFIVGFDIDMHDSFISCTWHISIYVPSMPPSH